MAFSAPYLDQTIALIVKDHRREEFSSRAAIRQLEAPRIGVPNIPTTSIRCTATCHRLSWYC